MLPVGILLANIEVPVDLITFFGCLIAGALGALVSVVSRMSADKFQVRHEVGRPTSSASPRSARLSGASSVCSSTSRSRAS